MRIALDATYSVDLQPSGIAVYTSNLLTHLAQSRPEDHFVACYRLKQLRRATRHPSSNVSKALLLPPFWNGNSSLFHALNQRVDGRPSKKIVSTFHDLFVMTNEYSSADFRSRFTVQARRAAERSDLIITVSEFTAGQVSGLLKVERKRIRVIPHGVHVPPTSTAVPRENMILFVGALQTRKNIIGLVEAFERLSDLSWKLVLAGGFGYGIETILQRIKNSPARDRIELPGYVSAANLELLYARASIFAFPSLDEGFGIPVLEAMAHGLPVVTSKTSALGEIGDGVALLVDPGDATQLTNALKTLIESEEVREDLAARGVMRAKLYSWGRAADSTYSVYKELSG